MGTDLTGAAALAAAVTRREVSARELVSEALARAEADACESVWAFVPERALARARALDAALAGGEPVGPLAGGPLAVKDSFDLEGVPSACGVRRAEPPAPAPGDAEAVARLVAAGAVPIGKTAMQQLAWDMSGEAPGFPVSRNPRDPGRMPGGSSAAIAAGIVPLALAALPGRDAELLAAAERLETLISR